MNGFPINAVLPMVIRLDLNECPYPPSQMVALEVSKYVNTLNRYFNEEVLNELLSRLSDYVGVEREFIDVVPGSESFITYSALRFRADGLRVLAPEPTFEPVIQDFINYGVRVERILLRNDFSLDWNSLIKRLEDDVVLYLPNPNNPTGNLIIPGEDAIIKACGRARYVVIDEAYYEFSGVTYAGLTKELSNLVIMRTLSKAFALAGARVGYVIAQPGTLKKILSFRRAFDTPILSYAAALGALKDLETAREYVRRLVGTREKVVSRLRSLGSVEVVNTLANYILVAVRGLSGVELAAKLRDGGVIVKELRHPMLSRYVRVSVGSEDEMDYFIKVLEGICESVSRP